jgi:hypothetical protein
MPAAFAALDGDHVATELDHLLRMFHRADGGDAENARIAESPIIFASGPRPKLTARTRSLLPRMISTISAAPGWNEWKFTPKVRGKVLQLGNRLSQLGRLHHRACQETECSGIARCRHQPGRGDPAHRGLDYRQAAAERAVSAVKSGSPNSQPSPDCFLFAAAADLPLTPPIELP